MGNPFAKEPVLQQEPTVKEFIIPEVDSQNRVISKDTASIIAFLHDCKGEILCTPDEITQLNGIEDRATKIEWLKEKIKFDNLSKVDEGLSMTLDEADVFKSIKDPLDISPEDLESMLEYTSDEEQKAKLQEVIDKARTQVRNRKTEEFVNKRQKRRADGTLDTFVSVDEMRLIDREVEKELKGAQTGRSGIRDAAKLSGVVNTLNDMSVDSRYAYEGYKEGVCNDFGITPESFDEWYAAVHADNMKRLNEEGINIRTDLYNVKEFQLKHKHLLKKDPNWTKGKIIWRSEFNKRLREIEAKEMREAELHATPQSRQLFNEMKTDTWHDPSNPVKLKKSMVSSDETKNFIRNRKSKKRKPLTVKSEIEKPTNNATHIHSPFVTLDDLVKDKEVTLSGPFEKIDGSDMITPMGERMNPETGVIESVPVSELIKHDEEPKVSLDIDKNVYEEEKELVTEEAKSVAETITEEDPHIRKYLKMGLSREQAELLAKNDKEKEEPKSEYDKKIEDYMAMGLDEEHAKLLATSDLNRKSSENTPVSSPEPVLESSTDKDDKIVVEAKEPRYNGSKGVIDDYSVVKQFEADPEILRRSGNRLEIIKQYRESSKRGRMLFLPNSNYEVYVKKIKSTESISYMTALLNNMKDMNLVDAYVKTEVLRICYDNIEFSFDTPVSYDDFTRCLHESDMTILMLMLALVNIPEDKDGKVPLEIKSVLCTNPECGAIGHLKENMVLDLKEEFMLIYPVELYSTQYAKYKSAGYKSIYHAYRDSEIGKLNRFTVKDEEFEYNFILSAPTVYKSQAMKAQRDETTYKRVLDRLTDRIDLFKSTNEMYIEVKDYMDVHTFQEFMSDLTDVNKGELEDDHSKKLVTMIADEMENVRNNDLPFYLIMDIIDQMTVTSLDGIEVVTNLDQKDVYTMIGILEQCPKEMLDKIIEIKNKTLEKSYPIDITFSAEDMAGRFDFDGYYGSDEEMVAEVTKRFGKHDTPELEEELNKLIEAQRVIRDDAKPKYEEEGKCFCGNETWKLNYTAILFFWTSNLSQIALS